MLSGSCQTCWFWCCNKINRSWC